MSTTFADLHRNLRRTVRTGKSASHELHDRKYYSSIDTDFYGDEGDFTGSWTSVPTDDELRALRAAGYRAASTLRLMTGRTTLETASRIRIASVPTYPVFSID